MRFIIISLLALGLSVASANAQVPAKVKEAFSKKFPMAQDVDWEELEEGGTSQYEATFIEARKEKTCKFLSNGTWLETATYLDEETEVPSVVKSVLKEELEGELSYDELKWVEKEDIAYYEVKITDEDDTEWTARITKNGDLLNLE